MRNLLWVTLCVAILIVGLLAFAGANEDQKGPSGWEVKWVGPEVKVNTFECQGYKEYSVGIAFYFNKKDMYITGPHDIFIPHNRILIIKKVKSL